MKIIFCIIGILAFSLTSMAQGDQGFIGQARGAVAQSCGSEALSDQNVTATVSNGCDAGGNIVVTFIRPFYIFPTCPPGQDCPILIPPPPPPCDYINIAKVTFNCDGDIIEVNCDRGCPNLEF